jgi:hypothetical protein
VSDTTQYFQQVRCGVSGVTEVAHTKWYRATQRYSARNKPHTCTQHTRATQYATRICHNPNSDPDPAPPTDRRRAPRRPAGAAGPQAGARRLHAGLPRRRLDRGHPALRAPRPRRLRAPGRNLLRAFFP